MNLLEDFERESVFAAAHKLTSRTVKRYRDLGLPWLRWGQHVYIGPRKEARAWVKARVRRTSGGNNVTR
jgi:hypothetical protein